jgi:DNA-binding MarR family transcriptional regulator
MALGYVLLNIDFENGTPSTKLGPQMGMEPRSLTRTLKSMEEKGLICRQADPNDKRMVRICLTELGIEMRELSKASVLHFNQTIQSKIGKKKLANFFDTMSEINTILETEQIFENEKINS